jgi:hypothetical protein
MILEKFSEKLANLIKVKTLVTLMVMAVFCRMALDDRLESSDVMHITATVVACYFGTQVEK